MRVSLWTSSGFTGTEGVRIRPPGADMRGEGRMFEEKCKRDFMSDYCLQTDKRGRETAEPRQGGYGEEMEKRAGNYV